MKKILFRLVFLLLPLNASAQTGMEIMKKVDEQQNVAYEETELKFLVIDKSNLKRERTMLRYYSMANGGVQQKILFMLKAPPDLRGTGLLTFKGRDGANENNVEQWLYLPELKKTRKIVAQKRSKYFIGTEFTYEDMGGTRAEDGTHALLRTENFSGTDCFVIETLPRGTNSGYSKLVFWVDQKRYVLRQVLFYDKQGMLLKTMETQQLVEVPIKSLIKSDFKYWRYDKMTLKNVQTQKVTLVEVLSRKLSDKLRDEVFQTRFMENGI